MHGYTHALEHWQPTELFVLCGNQLLSTCASTLLYLGLNPAAGRLPTATADLCFLLTTSAMFAAHAELCW
jgi:hypothetical protein